MDSRVSPGLYVCYKQCTVSALVRGDKTDMRFSVKEPIVLVSKRNTRSYEPSYAYAACVYVIVCKEGVIEVPWWDNGFLDYFDRVE